MGLSRRRDGAMIWPGFVDAVTTLLMVMMFVLTIFTVMQSVLRETITTQSSELDELNAQVAGLADALGLERNRSATLQSEIGALTASLAAAQAEGDRQASLVATLTGQLAARAAELDAATGRIASFEAQVASLLAERDAARGQATALTASLADLETAQARLITEKEALDLALASARTEIDAQTEAARLAAARREALEALVADLRQKAAESDLSLAAALAALQAADQRAAELATTTTTLTAEMSEAERNLLAEQAAAEALRLRLQDASAQLSEVEKIRLADLAAAEASRARLAASDDELTAMTLALEEQRRRAEETLTLLAAAEASGQTATSDAAITGGLLDAARKVLTQKDQELVEAAQKMAVLNQQIAALRGQLGALQAALDTSAAADADANVQINALGSQLNAALAQVAAEQKRRAELEEAERLRLEAENQDLSKFRSEFFGELSRVLAGREGVRVVGDRFVFSSEVLFQAGSADLAPEGRAQIAGVVATLQDVADQIPDGIDWIIRVDGHTDAIPLSGSGDFADNWELSQGRALSVVRYMQDELGFPPQRMAATGFGEYRPVAGGDDPASLAANRRIELKLTER
ncbi:MAG: peptidoglycan -binding protein [Paracoccaceae bacterium]